MEHLNEVARWWLSEINDRRVHGTTKKTPLELHGEEKPHLLSLPALRFDTAQVVYRLVDADYMFSYANNRYSVPWQQIGQMLPIRITEDELQVYNRSLNCIAKQALKRGPGCEKSVDPEQTNPEQPKCTGSEDCDAAFGDEPPRQEPPAPGGPEAEDASGSDRPDRS